MKDALIIIVMGATIAWLLYGTGPKVIVNVNEPMVCEVIKNPTTEYTYLCKPARSQSRGQHG